MLGMLLAPTSVPTCLRLHALSRQASNGAKAMPAPCHSRTANSSMSSPVSRDCSSFPTSQRPRRRCVEHWPRAESWLWPGGVPTRRFRSFESFAVWRNGIWAPSRISVTASEMLPPLETLLRDAGFNEVRSKVLSRTIRFEDGATYLRLNTMALVGMSAAGKAMSDQERKDYVEEIVSDSVSVQQSYTDGSALGLRTPDQSRDGYGLESAHDDGPPNCAMDCWRAIGTRGCAGRRKV